MDDAKMNAENFKFKKDQNENDKKENCMLMTRYFLLTGGKGGKGMQA